MKRLHRGVVLAGFVLSSCALAESPDAVVVQESERIQPTESADQGDAGTPTADDDPPVRQDTIDEPDSEPDEPTDDAADGDSVELTDAEVDELLEELQAAGFCDPRDVEDEGVVTAMHFVVQGELQDPCYIDPIGDEGEAADIVIDDDPRLLDAWNLLGEIAPIELVDDISLLAGYEGCASCDTLAFVSPLDEAATFFVVALDVAAAAADPDEMRLTMLHELTHVFAQAPGEQLVQVSDPDDCDTFFNGVGCFTDDSYLWAWIQEFWPPEIRNTLPADGSVGDDDDAFERCLSDSGYTGSYAAVHPEEDFAETFSAYVFDVDVDPGLAAKMAFFDRYPEFVAMRENARAAGYAGTEANFEGCGS